MEIYAPETYVYSLRRIANTDILTGDKLKIIYAVKRIKKTSPVSRYLVEGRNGKKWHVQAEDLDKDNPLTGMVHENKQDW